MANGDYGYFGKGDTGYAQYMTAFNRNFGGSSGGGGGGGNHEQWRRRRGRRQRLRLPYRRCGGWSCWCSSAWEAESIPLAQGSLA